MKYREMTEIEVIILVSHVDMVFIQSYLTQENYPPISVEAVGGLGRSTRPPPGQEPSNSKV